MFETLVKENGFDFVVLLEDYAEERIDEVSKLIENDASYYFYATDIDEKNNIKNFCSKFEVSSLEDFKVSLLNKFKREKKIIIISNIERMISKSNNAFIDFIKGLKEENIIFVVISKNSMEVKDLISDQLKDIITKIIDNEPKCVYDIFPNKSLKPIDLFTYYSIFGGNDRYLKHIDVNKSLKENLLSLILKTDSLFINEAKNILKIELRTLQIYNLILSVISKGAKTLSDISEKLELPTSICNKYTTVLINLGILIKIKPVYDADMRKSEYLIKNNLLDFIYYFVFENMGDIALGKSDKVFDEKILPNLDLFLKNKFAVICREYILKQIIDENKTITLKENGKWWDKNNEIDIVLGDSLKATVANCFWTDETIGKDKLITLEKSAEKLDVADRKYYLFAKRGFSDELKKIAKKRDDLELIDFNTIFEKDKKKFLFFK